MMEEWLGCQFSFYTRFYRPLVTGLTATDIEVLISGTLSADFVHALVLEDFFEMICG